jgi:hypothetical protein
MPYINQRDILKKKIDELLPYIVSKGYLNYLICELTGQIILRSGLSYTNIFEWIDAVHDAECEMRRRLLEPYEDSKIEEFGDLDSFEEIIKNIGR